MQNLFLCLLGQAMFEQILLYSSAEMKGYLRGGVWRPQQKAVV
jgi:hypothetical protein